MKNKYFILAVISIALLSFRANAPLIWKLDPVHSNLGFSILHLTVSDIKGTVKLSEATITTPGEDFVDAVILLKADMNSIDTDNDKRDGHLKTPDFFDAAKFPEVTFQSISFKRVQDEIYTIEGNLTLHGITKPVTLNASVRSATNATNNKPITGFKVLGSIKRNDFDIAATTPEAILSDEVRIEANLEFGKEEK